MAKPTDRRSEIIAQSTDVDALNHQRLAEAVIRYMEALPLGSVIAIQGSWGRGKTDVLARAYIDLRSRAKKGEYPEPLWLNPWQYGNPDLVRPVVLNLLARLGPEQRGSNTLRRAVKTLLRAGNAVLFKALTVVAPIGSIFAAAEGPIDDFLKELFDSGGQLAAADIDADPVAAMAERFRELVDEYLGGTEAHPTGRLVVCVDDLDRCLPDHQIAMLEAIYFLTAANANCSFLVALDPTLVQQAATTHYRTTGFDTNQYLDKLFNLRINLPTLRSDLIGTLISAELSRKTLIDNQELEIASVLSQAYSIEKEEATDIFGRLMGFLPELSNPRLVHRILERVQLLARASMLGQDVRFRDQKLFRAIVTWCIIAERWPQLRQTLQGINADHWSGDLTLVAFWHGKENLYMTEGQRKSFEQDISQVRNFFLRLPDKDKYPDLGQFIFDSILSSDLDADREETVKFVAELATVDEIMIDLGL